MQNYPNLENPGKGNYVHSSILNERALIPHSKLRLSSASCETRCSCCGGVTDLHCIGFSVHHFRTTDKQRASAAGTTAAGTTAARNSGEDAPTTTTRPPFT